MSVEPMPAPVSRATSYRESWCDGFWICFGFAIAFLLSFTIPAALLKWAARAVGGGAPRAVVFLLGGGLVAITGPIILSRVYRELEYPWMRKQLAKAAPIDPKMARPGR